MEYGKYVIVKNRGHEVAIVFDPIIKHIVFSFAFVGDIISAGFFRVGIAENKDIGITTFGKSTSLKLTSRRADAALIAKILKE